MSYKPYKGDIYRPQLPTSFKDGIEYPNQLLIEIWGLNEREAEFLGKSMGYEYAELSKITYKSTWDFQIPATDRWPEIFN